jgi:hypothetical protein
MEETWMADDVTVDPYHASQYSSFFVKAIYNLGMRNSQYD